MNRAPTKPPDMASPKYPATVFDVAAALKDRYRDFNHYNLKNPLDELLFIICSTKTGEASYRSTFRSLKETFPTHLRIAEAPAAYSATWANASAVWPDPTSAGTGASKTVLCMRRTT